MSEAAAAPVPRPMPYHEAIVAYLKTHEADLWQWFSSDKACAERFDSIRLDLLKSTYRVERGAAPELYGEADAAATALGLSAPVTIYQAQNPLGMNAATAYIPGEIHLILQGAVAQALTPGELRALFGHELAHFLLHEGWERRFSVAAAILNAMNNDRLAGDEHVESLRLFNLYMEVFCDRAALGVRGELTDVVAAQLKLQTGLATVSPASFLRQADEIFQMDNPKTDEPTHPEGFIRARSLRLWQERGAAADREIARMIEGTPAFDRLDLLGKMSVATVTRRVIDALLRHAWFRTDAVLGHARLFFEDFTPSAKPTASDALAAEIAPYDKGLRDYLCYVLLDFVTVDRALEDLPLAAAFELGGRLGVAKEFAAVAAKELGLKKKQLERLEATASGMLAKAETGASA